MGAVFPLIGCGAEASTGSDPGIKEAEVVCGDGLVSFPSESCDDGNVAPGDGCSEVCRPEPGYTCDSTGCHTSCGDGVVAGSEECDGTPYCNDDCTQSEAFCGDGIVQSEFEEQCDSVDDAAGLGGASPAVPGSAGCSECRQVFGYLCDSVENTCQQTGVDRTELAHLHMTEVCTLLIGTWGGEGATFRCTLNGVPTDITPLSVERCVTDVQFNETCTIGEIEDWLLGKTKCSVYTSSSPCD